MLGIILTTSIASTTLLLPAQAQEAGGTSTSSTTTSTETAYEWRVKQLENIRDNQSERKLVTKNKIINK